MRLTEPTIPPVFAVAGLGRCGTSLVMQMLAAGGMPCAGSAPDFEPDELLAPVDPAWLASQRGRAVKLLDPHLLSVPLDLPLEVIWMDRDLKQQAKSQAKFAHLAAGLPRPNRQHARRWHEGLARDRRAALAALDPHTVRRLRFEDVLVHPRRSAGYLAETFRHWIALDVARMAAQVRPRGTACAPGLDLEAELIAIAEARS